MKNFILSLLFFVSSIALGQSFIKGNVLYETPTVTTASGVTTAILVTSQPNQVLTGTTTQTYSLPDVQATSPDISHGFTIKFQNNSTGSAFFTYADGSAAAMVRAGERADFVLTSNATTNGTWAVKYLDHVKLAGDTMTGGLTVPSLNGITSSIIAYLNGLTANVQTQIDGKVNRAGDTMTGGLGLDYAGTSPSTVPYLDSSRRFTSSTITPTELGYLTGLTGNVQSQINAGGGGGATTFVLKAGDTMTGNLGLAGSSVNVNTVLTLDASRIVSSSAVTSTELGYLSGTTASVQTQLNALAQFFVPPTVQTFYSGSGTQNMPYGFLSTSISAQVGATYTHNSVTYAVLTSITTATIAHLTGPSAPLTSGTLTKISGTGDASIVFTAYKKPIIYEVIMVGGGGGGGPSGTSGSTAATAGGNSTLGSSFLTANGGTGGAFGGAAGAGGSYVINLPAIDNGSSIGGYGGGSSWSTNTSATASLAGGIGGMSCLGGNVAQSYAPPGAASASSTGSGGAGAGNGTTTSQNFVGSGGGAGGCIRVLIPNPSATYAYAVGAGGTHGFTLANGFNGGDGGAGQIIIKSIYQ